MKQRMKRLLPVLIVVAGITALVLFIALKPKPPRMNLTQKGPLVRVQVVHTVTDPLVVEGYGTVRPEHVVTVSPQVSGRVVQVAAAFVDGGFFHKGEQMLQIDRRDYEIAVTRATAQRLARQVDYQKALRQAHIAKKDWETVLATILDDPNATPDDLTLYIPQLKAAKAAFDAAEADLRLARLNLERTTIRAPFNGRILTRDADLGQFVTTGKPVATIFSTDEANVVVPLNDRTLGLFDIPCDAEVVASFAGGSYRYPARVIRTEGQLDPQSRMVHVVAQVKHPYNFDQPLENGAFVQVRIFGKRIPSVRLPAKAERDGVVWIADRDKLRIRPVTTLLRTPKEVVVQGISDGEQVIVSTLFAVTDGMIIRVAKDPEK